MNTFKNILNSTGLFMALLLATTVLGVVWVRAYMTDFAPDVPGVNWSQHPRSVLLLVPPKDCGCGMKPIEMAREAAAHGVDLVVASHGPNSNTDAVRQSHFKGSHIVVTEVSRELLKRLCPSDVATALRIHDGRVTLRVTGNLPGDFFDRFES